MKTVAIIQARMGSTRLPGKVMKTLCGKTVLGHVISRVQACPLVDEVIVATTDAFQDVAIVEEGQKHGAKIFRGNEEDVLSRYYLAAKKFGADIVVRVTSDCPLFDPDVLEGMLKEFLAANALKHSVDYLSNCLARTFPRGLDAEIFTFDALEKAQREASKTFEREHVTPYIYQHPQQFSLQVFRNAEDLSRHRWTLDTAEDFSLIEAIYSALYEEETIFDTEAVLSLLESNPELMLINSHVDQRKLEA